MAEWIDDGDCYRCPVCGFETHNPNAYGCKCPVCGFVADSDKPKFQQPLQGAQLQTTLKETQQHLRAYRMAFRLMKRRMARNDKKTVH